MNWQPLIDNLPQILATLALLLWAAARYIEAKAKADPKTDVWDVWAPRATWASKQYSQAIEWLVQSGAEKWDGARKLAELNARVKAFEEQWTAGNYMEAVTNLTGFYQAAKSKIEKTAAVTLPFAPRPSLPASPTPSQEQDIGPDDQAV